MSASSDASFRRYFRYTLKDKTLIAMDAPPETEDCRPFVDVANILAECGVRVPEILAQDLERGFLLLSDLGAETYLDVIDDNNADDLFNDAINALISIQISANTQDLPWYDSTLLRRELELFSDWYLKKHLDIEIDKSMRLILDQLFDQLIDQILSQSTVFVHRDFMPRNLMVCSDESSNSNPGILDFQDAVVGPISYDAICLFKDAFISWPEHKVERWLQQYWESAVLAGLPVPDEFRDFQRDCDFMGVQRHLKVIGIFARICHRDGKSRYLDDVPRFLTYLHTVVDRRPELASLKQLLLELDKFPKGES